MRLFRVVQLNSNTTQSCTTTEVTVPIHSPVFLQRYSESLTRLTEFNYEISLCRFTLGTIHTACRLTNCCRLLTVTRQTTIQVISYENKRLVNKKLHIGNTYTRVCKLFVYMFYS